MTPEQVPTQQQEPLHRLELIISQLLRGGVLISGMLLFVGWIWMWTDGKDIGGNLSEYNPQAFTDTLQWGMIMQDRGLLISMLGLIFLVLLPVLRVFLTGVLFLWQKEFRLGIMAFVVFAILVGSFFLGIEI